MDDILYCDGGVMGVNPSPMGGMFAWRHVVDGAVIEQARGLLVPDSEGGYLLDAAARLWAGLPSEIRLDVIRFDGSESTGGMVSNNHAELFAAIRALEAVPRGWAGQLVTDSQITINRLSGSTLLDPRYVPVALVSRMALALTRVSHIEYMHVAGHPTKADLKRGCKRGGAPVSRHQHWCDRECVRVGQWYQARIQEVRRDHASQKA